MNTYSNKKKGGYMPGFDKTGPRGEGSRTGRGLGICDVPAGTSTISVRPGYGPGYGIGRGTRWMTIERRQEQPSVSFSDAEVLAMQRVDIDGMEVSEVAKELGVSSEESRNILDSARTKAAVALFTDTGYRI